MSNRERWIIYPLLFLALGTSLKSKITRTLTVDEVRCRTLIAEQRVWCKTLIAKQRPGQSGPSDEAGNHVIIGLMETKSGENIRNVTGVFLVDPEGNIFPVRSVMEKGF